MEKVLVILGPTAVGKSALSIELAKQFNGEIINGDSVQIYKELNIGSAKVTQAEMQGIPHHLLDVLNPSETFSVALFQKWVRETIHDIIQRGKLPIICGGTGLYIQAALYDFHFEHLGRDETFVEHYQDVSDELLHQLLQKIDPVQAQLIHAHNRRRVLRALEIYEHSHETKTKVENNEGQQLLYNGCFICLDMERKILYDRINQRVEKMMENGLLNEVQSLREQGIYVQAIGYKEWEDALSVEETILRIKQNTRHYAKRQLTYFRNKLNPHFIQVEPHSSSHVQEAIEIIEKWLKTP